MRNGIPISGIDLWLFGGVAKLERDTDSPGVEFRVAVAGPLVTLAIAVICFLGAMALSGTDEAVNASSFDIGELRRGHRRARPPGVDQRLRADLQPDPGLPAGRRAHREGDRLVADRRPHQGHAARRPARPRGRLPDDRRWACTCSWSRATRSAGSGSAFIGWFLAQAARSAEVQAAFVGRIEGLRVADVMDGEPVAIPETLPLDRAEEEFFLRYGWPWFPVVDASGRLVGVVSREAVDSVAEQVRATRPVASVMARDEGESDLRVGLEDPLETLLSREGLARLGAIMAVDGDGVLRGIVTIDQVRRALRPA